MSIQERRIVRAAIYPAIGVARVGNSENEYFIGPEVTNPEPMPAGFYKDSSGALKRQAARFRVYGLDEQGKVVAELDAGNASITWRVEIANKKAAWYEFDVAMDIDQAKPVPLRNANIDDRSSLIIAPDPIEIKGINIGGSKYKFDDGEFMGRPVYLGELRTDEKGRLLFLGGHGLSDTIYPGNPPTTFANNDGWHDDMSDGPVDAEVIYNGEKIPVEGAWVVCAPPNYAPDIISVQTLYDVITDALSGLYIAPKSQPSFTHDIHPLLKQLSMNQWVNQGFYVAYGYAQPYDFTDHETIRRLSTITVDPNGTVTDDYREYRRQIFNYFRKPDPVQINAEAWPWMYGDNMNVPATTPNAYFSLTKTLYGYLEQWAAGAFDQDWNPSASEPRTIEAIDDPAEQAAMLTEAALWFCLGGPFHPGCEMTWPMRLPGMYTGPFRVRRRSKDNPEPPYAPLLLPDDFQNQNYFTTPLDCFWNGPGDITRWMACPWQTDTASCRSGYESKYDPYVPTFWPAHVPNTVLAEEDYLIVIDPSRPMEDRLNAFNRRSSWLRILGGVYLEQITNMIGRYGDLGVVEFRPGVLDSPYFPPEMYVESVPYGPGGVAGPVLLARVGEDESPEVNERLELAHEAAQIPRNRGLWVGPVGRAARNR
jgi:hypothetical protein